MGLKYIYAGYSKCGTKTMAEVFRTLDFVVHDFEETVVDDAERTHSDQYFDFWGEEGAVIKDDIYNHCTFFSDFEGGCAPFVDIVVQADYEDLIRYTGSRLHDQCQIRNTYKFWQDARSFRKKKPLPSIEHSVVKMNQLCEFNPTTLDDSSDSETILVPNSSDAETVVEADYSFLEITIPSEAESTISSAPTVMSLPVSEEGESFDGSLEVFNGSFEDPEPKIFEILPVADEKPVLLAISPPIFPVSEIIEAITPDESVKPTASIEASQLSQPVSDRPAPKTIENEKIDLSEYLEMIDFHSTTINQLKTDHAAELAQASKESELIISGVNERVVELEDQLADSIISESKWKERAEKSREDCIFSVNQCSATIEVLSAGLSLQSRAITSTKVIHQAILKPGVAGAGLHQIRIVEQPNQQQPRCNNDCIHNNLHNSLILCENCQFGVTASAAIGLLQNAIDRTKYVPRRFEEGHSSSKAGGPRPAKVIVVTEATDGMKRKVERKIKIAKRKALTVPAPSSAENADESVTETGTFPDFDMVDEFDQSTTKFGQAELKFTAEELAQMHKQHQTAVELAQAKEVELSLQDFKEMKFPRSLNIIEALNEPSIREELAAEREKVENSAGLKIFMITKELVCNKQLTYDEATQSVKINHPLLYAKWEAEKADELKQTEARYGAKVEIINGQFQRGHNVFKLNDTSPGSNDFKVKFGLGAIHHGTTPPTAAFQISRLVKEACAKNGYDFNLAEADVRKNHPELVKMAEAELCVQAQSDHDEFFSCPSN